MPSVEAVGNNLAEVDAYADLKVAVTGQYIGLVMKLTKSLVNVDRNTTIAALAAAEADFDGYAAFVKTVTPGPALIDPADRAEDWLVGPTFTPSGTTTPNQVYNAWIENGAGLLILAWNINGVAGIQMASPTDAYQATARHRVRYDATVEQVY
jgi:hypothetical protein